MKEPKEISAPKVENFCAFLTELKQKLQPGKVCSIYYNGDSEIVCSISGQTILKAINIDKSFAKEVSLYLITNDYVFKTYNVSSTAFEAVYKKKRRH